jgi:hypothetical protein
VRAAVDEAADDAVAGDHDVLHGGDDVGQSDEEARPEGAVRLAAVRHDDVVVDVVRGDEAVDEIRVVGGEHVDVGVDECAGVHVVLFSVWLAVLTASDANPRRAPRQEWCSHG